MTDSECIVKGRMQTSAEGMSDIRVLLNGRVSDGNCLPTGRGVFLLQEGKVSLTG